MDFGASKLAWQILIGSFERMSDVLSGFCMGMQHLHVPCVQFLSPYLLLFFLVLLDSCGLLSSSSPKRLSIALCLPCDLFVRWIAFGYIGFRLGIRGHLRILSLCEKATGRLADLSPVFSFAFCLCYGCVASLMQVLSMSRWTAGIECVFM